MPASNNSIGWQALGSTQYLETAFSPAIEAVVVVLELDALEEASASSLGIAEVKAASPMSMASGSGDNDQGWISWIEVVNAFQ